MPTTPRTFDDAAFPTALVDYIAHERCVIVAGSGLSRHGARLPTWGSFVKRTRERLKPEASAEATDENIKTYRLEFLEWAKSNAPIEYPAAVSEILHTEPDAVPVCHRTLAELPSTAVVTTNLDTLIEDAFSIIDRPTIVVSDDRSIGEVARKKGTPIVKMHGSINSDQQVLTLEEYHDFDIKRHAMRSLILSYLTQYPVLMLGTGLVDPNFQKLHSLVNQSLQGFQHPVYCVHSAVPKFVRDVWAKRNFRFIAVEHKDLTAWLIELSRRVQDRGGEILSHGPREVNVYVKEKALGWLARDLDGYKRLQDSYTALIHMPDYGWFTGPWEQTLYSPLRRYIRKQIGSRFPGGDDIRFLYCAPGPHAPVLAHESNAALLRNMKQVCMLDIDLEVSHSACKTLEHLGSGDTKLTPAILDFTSGAGQKLCDHLNEIANRLMEGIAPPSSGSAVEEIEAILPLDTLASLGAGQAAQLDGAGDYSVAYSEMVASFTATPVHMAFRTHLFQHIEEIGEPRAHSALEYASELWQYFNQRIFGAHLAFMAATVRPGGLALVAVDTEKIYDDGSNTIFSFPTKEPNERLRETKTPLRRIDTKDFPWRDHAFAFEAKINGMPIDDFKRHSHKVYLYTYERSQ